MAPDGTELLPRTKLPDKTPNPKRELPEKLQFPSSKAGYLERSGARDGACGLRLLWGLALGILSFVRELGIRKLDVSFIAPRSRDPRALSARGRYGPRIRAATPQKSLPP